MSAMIFLRRLEDTVAGNQHPPAQPSRQRFLGHKGNHRHLASIEFPQTTRPTLVEMTASGKLSPADFLASRPPRESLPAPPGLRAGAPVRSPVLARRSAVRCTARRLELLGDARLLQNGVGRVS